MMPTKTTVANLHHVQARDLIKAGQQPVRICRPTKWGNPFVVGKDGTHAEVIAKYAEWIRTQPDLIADLESLRGKVMLCWCHPAPCHGDVLIQLLDEVQHDLA